MRTLNYKGYQASVEYEDGALFVRVLHINDVLVGRCDSAAEATSVAQELIDSYLEDCRELGKEPDRPYKGSFNVRLDPEHHKAVARAAADAGQSLNAWVSTAIVEKLESERP